jgi:integrase/recombinase XerC
VTALPSLPLGAWPDWALATWRQGDGSLTVPDATRRALGRYLATLRQRGLPLDAIAEPAIVDHLGALERHHRAKEAFYIAVGHLIAALVRVHPDANWEWLRRWRLDWRLAAFSRRRQIRPEQELPFSAEPFPQWPRDLREAWKANMPAEWRGLTDHGYRRAYGRYRAYCRTRNLPVDLTRERVEAYADFLVAEIPTTIGEQLRLLHGALAVLAPDGDWSWLVQRWRALAKRTVAARRRSARATQPILSLPFAAWPAEDRLRWTRRLAPPRAGTRLEHVRQSRERAVAAGATSPLLDEDIQPVRRKPPPHWSAATIRSARYAYGAFLMAMRDVGWDAAVTPASVAIWVDSMLHRMTPLSLGNRVRDLHAAMLILHPERDWHWLQADAGLLLEDARPTREKIPRIAPVDEIREAAIRRMARAEQAPRTIRNALRFQDGFLLLLLAYRPVRCRNLAATRLGIDLVFASDFKTGRLRYAETKNGEPYDAPLPERLLPWARKLVTLFRPLLAGPQAGDAAWLSRLGTPLSDGQLRRRIARASEEEVGKRITPHLFRDCLATSVSETAPERIEDAARLLGHRTPPRPGKGRGHARTPAIETYRQVSGSTAAGRRLAALQDLYRVRPQPRRRPEAVS